MSAITDTQELKALLRNYYCTENYHYNPMYRKLRYTDGVKAFAEHAGGGAYWFLDIIGTEFLSKADPRFCVISLIVTDDSWKIEMQADSDMPLLYSREGDFTDCPEGVWKFYLIDNVMLLPSEY
jgi:hypothetical protein